MTFDQFIEKYNNKGIDFDGAFGNQCVDLYRQYVKEVLGFPQSPAVAGAKDIWDTYLSSFFTRYNNSPTAVPKKGDILIWGTKMGQYGHVAVFIDGGVTKFNSFDQNSPVGTLCHIQSHTYTGVLGWLRPKENAVNEATPSWLLTLLQERGLTINNESEIRTLFDKAKRYDDEVKELQEQVKSANESLSDKSLEVSTLLGKLQKAESRISELEPLYNNAKSERDSFSWEVDKLKIKVDELEKGMIDKENQITQLKIDLAKSQTENIGGMTLIQLLLTYFKRK